MLDITAIIIDTIWLYLPAAVANTVPVFAARYNWTPFLDKPIDANAKWGGIRILGDHKTWRGLVLGTVVGTLVGALQGHGLALAFALSFGALAGDAIKSLIKRRSGIPPGYNLPVLDQIDYVLGASLGAALVARVPIELFVTAIVIFGIGSAITSFIGYKLHIKKSF
jgi:CDP-2,3-bis-(O-geranylgeranyl)-sn-glycerol synthase